MLSTVLGQLTGAHTEILEKGDSKGEKYEKRCFEDALDT